MNLPMENLTSLNSLYVHGMERNRFHPYGQIYQTAYDGQNAKHNISDRLHSRNTMFLPVTLGVPYSLKSVPCRSFPGGTVRLSKCRIFCLQQCGMKCEEIDDHHVGDRIDRSAGFYDLDVCLRRHMFFPFFHPYSSNTFSCIIP